MTFDHNCHCSKQTGVQIFTDTGVQIYTRQVSKFTLKIVCKKILTDFRPNKFVLMTAYSEFENVYIYGIPYPIIQNNQQ
jgi:hypothetical protein